MDLKHQFLLAMPELEGHYFENTLTYVCEHTDKGAMGLVVNRESDMTLLELLSQVGLSADRSWVNTPVHEGGPVATERGTVLHSDDVSFESSASLDHGLAVSTAMDVLEGIAQGEGPRDFLVCLGYVGWEAGQLEEEIQNNVWVNTPAERQIIFHEDNQQKCQLAADILGIDMSLISSKPGYA